MNIDTIKLYRRVAGKIEWLIGKIWPGRVRSRCVDCQKIVNSRLYCEVGVVSC